MRITYLHQYFVTPQAAGGTRSYEYARLLIAKGHKVTVITSAAMLPDVYARLRHTTHTIIDDIPVVIIPIPYTNHMSFALRIRSFLQFALLATWEAILIPTDVVFATSTPLTIAIPGIAAKLWRRVPMVFEVRDLWPELPIAIGALSNPLLRACAFALEWIAYHSAAHIIALSPGMKEGVMRRNISAEDITVIPNGCDLDRFAIPVPALSPIHVRLRLLDGQPLVVYTGTFGLINDVGWIIEIAALMKNLAPHIHFLLVGDGAEYEKIVRQARERGVLDTNLTIWKPIPKEEIPSLVAEASVVTSLFAPIKQMWNNSANKFFDGLAASKPIAINYGGWQADLLAQSRAGIVLPYEDTVASARMLADFVNDPTRLQAAQAAAHKLAHEQFDRQHLVQKLEAVLHEVKNEVSSTMP